MPVQRSDALPIRNASDVVAVRQLVRTRAQEAGFNLVDQTRIVTAASELARNTLDYGGGGRATVQVLTETGRTGLRMLFEDEGPGIPDIELALRDGYTTGHGLGLGLGGARRLMNDLRIESQPGKGTRVDTVRWR
ncbi:MAG TPA: anti-sigma regulatory factor [Gemmatimonadales bacterium]|jgi:serine/threonine-protein kinase RsbT|nr:anti-sigma regulatory factor [Gemmatimonadales bacterium]